MKDRKPPAATDPAARDKGKVVSQDRSSPGELQAFMRQARALGAQSADGAVRLILALDATMSRQPTWDMACELQAEMFDAVGRAGDLQVQLVYFRGFGECRASRFIADTAALKRIMSGIDCRGGHTQIGKVLSHALKEKARGKVSALVFIGDAMEEDADDLARKAGELGVRGVPVFIFQKGTDAHAEATFRDIARLTKGAWFRFDGKAAATLGRLLASIAVYATGGLKALETRGKPEDLRLIENLRGQ